MEGNDNQLMPYFYVKDLQNAISNGAYHQIPPLTIIEAFGIIIDMECFSLHAHHGNKY